MTWEGMGENNSVNPCHCNPEDKERLAFGVTVDLGIREGTAVSKNRTCQQLGDTVWVHVFFSFNHIFSIKWSFPGSSMVRNPPAMQEPQETQVQSLGWEDPLKEGMITHSSILAWRIPWMGSLVGYSHGVGKSWTWLKQLSMHALYQVGYYYSHFTDKETGTWKN